MNERLRGTSRAEFSGELASRFHAGQPRITIADLAASSGRRTSTVRRLLDEAGVRCPRCLIGLGDDEVTAALVERRQAGAQMTELSVLTGLDEQQIRDRLQACGVPPAARRQRSDLSMTVDELAGAYHAGSSIDEVAALAGGSYSTVRRILIAAGVQFRPGGSGITTSRS